MRRGRALQTVGAACLAVVLTGCMKIDMDLTVTEEDTVDGVMIMAVDQELAEMSGGSDAMLEDMLGSDAPEGATAEPYEDDDFIGTQYTFEDLPLDEFAFDESDTETLSIVHEGEEIIVSGAMDMSDAQSDLEGLGEDAAFAEQFMDSMEIRIAITFPGEVLETTGEVDGTTVTWEPQIGEMNEISARAKDSGGAGLPVWAWILIAVVVIAAVVGLLFLLSRSRRTTTDEPADTTTAAAATPDGFPPPPPADSGPSAAGAAATGAAAAGAGAFAADQATDGPAPDEVGSDDVAATDMAGDEPVTFGEDVTDAVDVGEEEPAAPPAPAPPPEPDPFATPDDAGEAPQDITGVADTSETDTDIPPADAQDGGDTLEPPR